MNAKEILEKIKTSKGDIDFAIVTKNDGILVNTDTKNIMGIFGYHNDEYDFYGVYSQVISSEEFYGQVDSRIADDATILKYIEELLKYGKVEDRDEALKRGCQLAYLCEE